VDPAAEVERVVDAVHHLEGLHEGLLGDVLGEQRVAELAAHEPVDRGHIPAVKLLECPYVAAAISPDEVDVGRFDADLGRFFGFFCHSIS
jgi:hypothetical protein